MAIKNLCWGIVLLLFCGLLHQGQLSCTLNPGGQVVHFDVNPETIIIENLIGEENLKEIIFGTKDEKLAVLNPVHLRVHFLIPTEGNVTHIEVADINNDGQNELIFTTEDNLLYTCNCKGRVLFKKDLEDESPNDILDFTFLDVNKDGATDIIVGTSSGITTIDGTSVCIETADATEKSIWSLTDRSLSGIWPLQEGSSLHLTTADIDNFEEKEIIGYTENTVFALSYSGGVLWKRGFNKITALSIYNDPKFYPKKCIMVALADRTLFKIDYNGNRIPWSNEEEVSKDIGMTASKIVPSKSDAASDKHTFFFIISDKKEAKAFTLSGEKIKFEFNSNILDIECANLDDKEIYQYSAEDYEEIVVSRSDGEVEIFTYDENRLRELEFGFPSRGEDSEEVKFSKLIKKDENCFIIFRILFQVSKEKETKEVETWKIRRDGIFADVQMFFSLYGEAEEDYSEKNYGTAFLLYDKLLRSYEEIAKYYGFYNRIFEQRENCDSTIEKAKREVIKDINSFCEKGSKEYNKENFFGAIIDFYEAYKKFEILETLSDVKESSSSNETPEISREEVEDYIIRLLFLILDDTHQKYEQGIYEEAYKYFLGIYPIHGEFLEKMKIYIEENKSFEEYEYLIEEYKDQKAISESINSCIENLKKDADNSFDRGEFEESRRKYQIVKEIIEKEEIEVSYTVEYTVEEIYGKISECEKEIKKRRNIYICISVFIAFLCVLIFKYRREIEKKLFQKERWTTEELYNRLDESEKLLNTGYPEPAANLAGKVLEKALKMYIRKDPQLYQQWNPDKDSKKERRAPLGQIVPWLSKYDSAVDEIQTSKLNTWRMIRNRSSHDTEEELHKHDIDDMIEGIRDFVARYLEPKYQRG